MQHKDVLHLLLPGLCRGDEAMEFRDFMGQCEANMLSRYEMEIRAVFPGHLTRFDLELKPGLFDYETLYVEMTEYPGGEFVKTGPWDLAMDPPLRMQIPVLEVYLDGELYGKMWFEMPSPEDIKYKRLGGVFALPFAESGRHAIRIRIPEEERKRLDFSMVDRIAIRRDDRDIPAITPRASCNRNAPWLFLDGRSPAELRELKTAAGAVIWQGMADTVERFLSTGEEQIRGSPILAGAAFMALVEEAGGVFQRLVALLDARCRDGAFYPARGRFVSIDGDTGQHSEKHRWLMGRGWNDYGFSFVLMDYCCVYQWLGERLPAHIKQWIRSELIKYGRALYRFIVFQRQYAGAQGHYEAHGIVPPLAVTALGATLYRECDEAATWIDFGVGRVREAIHVAPTDGKPPGLGWGTVWLARAVELLLALTGEDHRRIPFFRALPTAMWRTHHLRDTQERQQLIDFHRLLLAAYCASHLADKEAQWYYHRMLDEQTAFHSGALPACYLNVLWHSAAIGESPSADDMERSCLFPDVSLALLQSNYEKPRFAVRFQCGPINGKSNAYLLESYNSASMGNPFAHGGFEVWMNNRPVLVDLTLCCCRRSFKYGNFVTVDGDGFFMDGAGLSGRADKAIAAFIRRSEIRDDYCSFDGMNTPCYRPELEMTMSRRRIFFEVRQEWAIIVDEVASRQKHEYALLLHASQIETVGRNSFRCFGGQDGKLCNSPFLPNEPVGPLHVLCLAGQPTEYEIAVTSMALGYIYGVTQIKGGPKLTGDLFCDGPPLFHRIVCKPESKRMAARFLTVVSPHEVACEMVEENLLVVRNSRGECRLSLTPERLLPLLPE